MFQLRKAAIIMLVVYRMCTADNYISVALRIVIKGYWTRSRPHRRYTAGLVLRQGQAPEKLRANRTQDSRSKQCTVWQ